MLIEYTHLLVSISIRSRYSFDFDKTCVRMSGKLTPFRIFIGQRYDFPIIPFWWGFKASVAIWAFNSNKEFS
ncbi:unnamed protein product [Rhizophagus irregularis]|nr:unnamed protein product [Rhizophagus irregularis]